jgi:coenzyme F420-reducing hydrogenase alpha subunit
VRPTIVASTTLVEAGRGVTFHLALIALLVMTMLVLTLLNVSAVQRIVPRAAQKIVPARKEILSTEPAGLGSSSDSFGLSAGQLGNGGRAK